MDGQRIGNSTSGDSNLQHINIEQVERVEVLRGSRSVIYGSDAIGGVIQIFTRRGAEQGLQPRLHMGFGSNQTWERSLGLSGGDEQTRFNLGASLDETAGINRTHESYPSDGDHDEYRNKSVSLSLSHALTDDIEIGANLLDNRGKSEFDNPFGRFDMNTFESVQQQPYSEFTVSSVSSYVDARVNDLWKTRVEFGHSENREKTFDKLSDERSVFNTYRDSVNWQNDLTLNERNSLILGGDWYEDRINSSTRVRRGQPLEPRGVYPASLSGRQLLHGTGPAPRPEPAVRQPEQLERHLHPAAEPGQRCAADLQRRLPRTDLQ